MRTYISYILHISYDIGGIPTEVICKKRVFTGFKKQEKKRETLSHKHKMFLIFSLLEYLAEIERGNRTPILVSRLIRPTLIYTRIAGGLFTKWTGLCHYLTLSVSWQQHSCCLVDNLLGKTTMIYGITWLIKYCLKLKLLCKLSVPFGDSPSRDENKKTEHEISEQSISEASSLRHECHECF